MKSERRHELQHNDLAEWATRTYESVMPFRTSILGVTLLLIVGLVAWQIWHGHSESQTIEAWNAVEPAEAIYFPVYESPNYPGAMDKVSQNYSGSPAAEWAQILTADSCLFLGQAQLMGNKEAATNFLNNGMERYEKTIAASAGPMAHERALFGKARILESVGKLPEATAAYQDLIKEFPQGTYKAIADQRLEQLGKPDTADFYKALAEYKPKPKKEAVEKSAAGPSGKAESMKLPENPDMPPFAPPAKSGESSSGTASSAPKSSGTGTAPKAETSPKAEPPKSTATTPPQTETPKATATSSAPAVPATSAMPAKKDK